MWIEQFTAYFYSGRLDTLSILEQHGYFKNCLNPSFTARISDQLTPTMPVFDMEGSQDFTVQGDGLAEPRCCIVDVVKAEFLCCLLYTSPSPRDRG